MRSLHSSLGRPFWPLAVASAGTSSAGPAPQLPGRWQPVLAKRVCSTVTRPGWASCLSVVRTDVAGRKGLYAADATPGGYGPNDLQDAYDLPSATAVAGQTVVAIVDAYDDPNAEADLAVYRQTYGLPPCTTANGCFAKVNQQGATAPARPRPGLGREISLDVDAVSAVCPCCHILLVEADTAPHGQPRRQSWTPPCGSAPQSCRTATAPASTRRRTLDAAHWEHPGVPIVSEFGDSGYGISFPAASPDLTSVGGTS